MPHLEMSHRIQSKHRLGRAGPYLWACAAIAVFAALIAILYGFDPGFIRTAALVAGMLVFGYCVRCCLGTTSVGVDG